MSENKRPFVGHVVSGGPVTIKDLKEAGLIPAELTCPFCGGHNVDFNLCASCGKNVTEKTKTDGGSKNE
jgi:hypothetical protein